MTYDTLKRETSNDDNYFQPCPAAVDEDGNDYIPSLQVVKWADSTPSSQICVQHVSVQQDAHQGYAVFKNYNFSFHKN